MGNCWPAQIKAESPVYEIRSRRSSSSSSCSGHSHKKENGISFSSSSSSTTMFTTSQNLGDMSNRFGGSSLRAFNFNDLKAATQSFHCDNLLGEGGFGCVYKGWVNEHDFTVTKPGTGMVVAVKKLNLEGLQGHKEWLAEVYYLGQLHHPNLVKLIGFCAEDDHRLLVYEYLQRGSLDDHLFRRRRNQPLSWALRMKIVLGAAKGLVFLHVAERQVIYRDFKTSNILLDNKYNAKLSDFGLAKDGPTGDNTHVSTRILGTFGYAAPEYVATGHLTAKSDVYSFGVVLLEILTGKRAVDRNRPDGEQNLVKWAKPFVTDKRKFYRIIDSQLEGQLSIKDAHKVAALALCCLDSDAKNRPDMEEVVEFLDSFASKHSQNLLASTEPNPHSQPINASS